MRLYNAEKFINEKQRISLTERMEYEGCAILQRNISKIEEK